MQSDDVIVKKSSIEGNGVFAYRNFKKGEVVLHWDISHTLSKEKVDSMSNEEKKYISFLENRYVVMQKPEKFVNHSCDANTTAKNFCDVAKRDISKAKKLLLIIQKNLLQMLIWNANVEVKTVKR